MNAQDQKPQRHRSERSFFHCQTITTSEDQGAAQPAAQPPEVSDQIVLLASGTVTVQLERIESELSGPLIIYAPRDLAHEFRFSANAFGIIYRISHDFIEQIDPTDNIRDKFRSPGYHMPSNLQVKALLELARHAMGAQKRIERPEMLKVFDLFSEAWIRLAVDAEFKSSIDEKGLAIRFRNLVNEYYAHHKPISFYADRLNCTVRTLARHTHEIFGMAPRQLINQRMMREAQHLLRVTNANCTSVARDLGFDDPSYFSRVYRRTMGSSPSAEKATDTPHSLDDPN